MLVYWRVRTFTCYKVCLYRMCILQRHIAVSHIVHGTKMINIKFAQSDHSSSLKRVPWPSTTIQRGLFFFRFPGFWFLASVGFWLVGFWLLFSVGFWLLASVGFYPANPAFLRF